MARFVKSYVLNQICPLYVMLKQQLFEKRLFSQTCQIATSQNKHGASRDCDTVRHMTVPPGKVLESSNMRIVWSNSERLNGTYNTAMGSEKEMADI